MPQLLINKGIVMDCHMTVHDFDGTRLLVVDDWTLLVALAGLSAEPEKVSELEQAMQRYLPGFLFPDAEAAPVATATPDGPWCLIDLVGRTVVGGGMELPDKNGAYQADDGEEVPGFRIVWLGSPRDWLFQEADDNWQALVGQRASLRQPHLDARAVLFGTALLQFISQRVRGAANDFRAHDGQDEATRRAIRAIHAEWLMTPRSDLNDCTPRHVLLRDRHRLALDLQHRQEQWSRQGHPPPGLSPASAAYRFAGFGTIEVVLYFDLVRFLLNEAWTMVARKPDLGVDAMVLRLAEARDNWLAAPYEDSSSGMTAAELMERGHFKGCTIGLTSF